LHGLLPKRPFFRFCRTAPFSGAPLKTDSRDEAVITAIPCTDHPGETTIPLAGSQKMAELTLVVDWKSQDH
jgi:hypothetical protein